MEEAYNQIKKEYKQLERKYLQELVNNSNLKTQFKNEKEKDLEILNTQIRHAENRLKELKQQEKNIIKRIDEFKEITQKYFKEEK